MKKLLSLICYLAFSVGMAKAQNLCPSAEEISSVLSSVGRNAITTHVTNNLKKSIKEHVFPTLALQVRQEKNKNGDTMCYYHYENFAKPLFAINLGQIKGAEDVKKIQNNYKR